MAKAEIVVQSFGGKHNDNIEETRARLLRSNSWRKQRIVVIIPAGDLIPFKVALSMWNLMWPPNQNVFRMGALGMEVGEAYSSAIEQVLQHPELSTWEYILTMEHDNMPPYDGVLRLIEQMEAHPEFICIGGLYFTKGEGGVAQIWGDPKDPILNFRPQVPIPGQLVECNGTGMGFNLWRMRLFKDEKLRKPWFRTVPNGTQDLYFWGDARKYGYRCAVDCSIGVGHYDHVTDMVW